MIHSAVKSWMIMGKEVVTRQSTLDELVITESGGACSPSIVKALNSIQSYLNSLIGALETRFENEVEDSFVHDIKKF